MTKDRQMSGHGVKRKEKQTDARKSESTWLVKEKQNDARKLVYGVSEGKKE